MKSSGVRFRGPLAPWLVASAASDNPPSASAAKAVGKGLEDKVILLVMEGEEGRKEGRKRNEGPERRGQATGKPLATALTAL
jgi:hypothetical protein